MRFDITLYTHVGETYPWEKIVDEAETQVKFADQAGFTTFWMAEHHFAWDGWYNSAPNPILMGTKLSRLSDRLRFGQCGVVLPDWHPLRIAEDIALMDQFTKGRVDFGIARGIDTRASIQFNLNADRRNQESNYALFSESLDVITGAWTQEAFQHEGRFYKFPVPGWIESNSMVQNPDYHAPNGELKAMGVFPKPFQKPHPPIWQMADSPGSHRFAGSRGMGVFCQSISLGKIKQVWTAHNEAMSKAQNRDVPFGEKLCIVRPTYVAETYEQAIADVSWGSKQLGAWYSHNPVKAYSAMATEDELDPGDFDLPWFDFQLKHGLVCVGTPDTISEQIENLQSSVNCGHLALFLNFPGLTFEKTMRSLTLFVEKVMPRFL